MAESFTEQPPNFSFAGKTVDFAGAVVQNLPGVTGLEVKEADGSPAVANVSSLQFNQADGLQVTQIAPGVARVSLPGGAPGGAIVIDPATLGGKIIITEDDAGLFASDRFQFDHAAALLTIGDAAGSQQAGVKLNGTNVFALTLRAHAPVASRNYDLPNDPDTGGDEVLGVAATGPTITRFGWRQLSAFVGYTGSVDFTRLVTAYQTYAINSALAIAPNVTGARPGYGATLRLVADGVNAPSFSAPFKESNGSSGFDNRAGILNTVACWFDGVDYWYAISQEVAAAPVDLVPPVLLSAHVDNDTPNQIELDYNEPLNAGSVPAVGAFTVSGGKTVTGVAVAGSKVTVTVNTPYVNGNVITINYTAGASPIEDTAGNNALNLVSQSVTNNVAPADVTAPTLSTATVESGAPNQIVLTYSELLNTGSVPAVGAFAVSGGKTVTNVAIVGNVVTVTVNTAYAQGDTVTISYTAGASPIEDVAGNNAANLVAQAVTNNIGNFFPSDLSGLQWWLESDSLALADGDPVASWLDASSFARDVSQANASQRPIFKTNVLNGKPVVRFDGADDALEVASFFNLNAFTVFFVYKNTGTASFKLIAGRSATSYFSNVNNLTNRKLRVSYTSGGQQDEFNLSGGYNFDFYIESYTKDGTNPAEAYQDNNTATPTATPATNQSMEFGNLGGFAPYNMPLDLAAVIVYNRKLTPTERNNVRDYLNAKYATF